MTGQQPMKRSSTMYDRNRRGDDYTDNRRDLAAALVRCEGKYVIVGGLPSGPGGEMPIVCIQGGEDLRDSLREVVVALLTTVAHEVQDRWQVTGRWPDANGTSIAPPIDPDALIGGQLARAVRGVEEAAAHCSQ